MNNHAWFDAIGWTGAAALLVAYAMVSSKKLEGDSIPYQFLNVVGSPSFGCKYDHLRSLPFLFC